MRMNFNVYWFSQLKLSVIFYTIQQVIMLACLKYQRNALNHRMQIKEKYCLYGGRWDYFSKWKASRYLSTSLVLADLLNFNVSGQYMHALSQIIHVQPLQYWSLLKITFPLDLLPTYSINVHVWTFKKLRYLLGFQFLSNNSRRF